MTKTPPPTRGNGGIAGLVFLFCATAAGAGLAFDLLGAERGGWWLGAEPGAAAVIGVGAAALVLIAGHTLRAVLGKRAPKQAEGARDASHHA